MTSDLVLAQETLPVALAGRPSPAVIMQAGPVPAAAREAPVFREVRWPGVVSSGATVRLREGTAPKWAGTLLQALGGSCSP